MESFTQPHGLKVRDGLKRSATQLSNEAADEIHYHYHVVRSQSASLEEARQKLNALSFSNLPEPNIS
jgi:hypothetical protein